MPQRQPKAGDLIRLSISISPTLYDEIKAEGIERDMSFSGIVSERLEELADLKRTSTKEWKGRLDTAMLAETSGEGRSAAGGGEVSPSEMGRAIPAPAASTVKDAAEELAERPEPTGPVPGMPIVVPSPPQADPDKHRGHKVEDRGYMKFCVDCKERAR